MTESMVMTEPSDTMAVLSNGHEDLFRNFVEQSLDGIMLVDEQGKIVEWNASQESITGLVRNEALGRPFWAVQFQLAPPESKTTRLSEHLRHALSAMLSPDGGERWAGKLLEQEIERPDRTRRVIQVMPFLVRMHGRALMGSITRDVTERRAAEMALGESEALQRALLDHLSAGVMIVDAETRIIERVNNAAAKMAGAEPHSIIGKVCHQLICPADQGKCPILDLGIKVDNMERALLRSDGTTIPVIKTVTGITIGGRKKLLECFVDITERKRMEENLVKAQKLESLGLLAGGIAHDFNNLLGGIFGYIELAREKAEANMTAKVVEYLSKALKSYHRAADLSRQILTFARGGAPQRVNGDLGRTVRDMMEFALSGSTIKAACEIAEDLWPCNFDPNQIGQAIDNILINAKQATKPGGVIEVRVENRMLNIGNSLPLPPGEYVCVTVRDHGEGITAEHLPKIFDPFFSTKKGGYGLGLATSWSIVKRHDGFIDVESTGKNGTAFFLYLPASRTGKTVEERKREVPLRGRGRLLLMDDEDSLRETGAQLLRSLGYRVVVAREGREAVERFAEARKKKRPFDLVILDLTVKGGMGGKDALASIYKKDNTVLAIASSGYSEDPIMADPRSYGFAASVRKPYRKEEIGEAVALLLAPPGKRSNAESPVRRETGGFLTCRNL